MQARIAELERAIRSLSEEPPITLTRTRTSEDLVLEALANLGVLSASQPTDPEDVA